jgi:hypothetical protein
MNATNCLAGGVGIFAAGYWKSRLGLGTAFSAGSVLLIVAAVLLAIGYRFFAGRELTTSSFAGSATICDRQLTLHAVCTRFARGLQV